MADDTRSTDGVIPGVSGADEAGSGAGQVQSGQESEPGPSSIETESQGADSQGERGSKQLTSADSGSIESESTTTIVVRLCLGGVLVGAVLAFPAHLIAGVEGLEGLALALSLCVVPGVVTLFLAPLVPDKHIAFLVGSTLRLMFALGGAIVVRVVRPSFGLGEFYLWLILCYMFALAFETVFILKRKSK